METSIKSNKDKSNSLEDTFHRQAAVITIIAITDGHMSKYFFNGNFSTSVFKISYCFDKIKTIVY